MSSAAALQLHPRTQPTTVPPGPRAPDRPVLRVLEGGRAPARVAQRAVYRRRRLAAVVGLALLVVTVLLLANAVVAKTAGGGAPHPVAGTSVPAVHVVQPGETLWSIARTLAPEGDVRLVVDRLVDLNGSAPLQVGQRLELG
ncbi:MAG: LysM peptidoglycan-binding domain-containing protein [Microthrixaceae bacterium]